MATYLQLGAYNASGAASVMASGLVARRQVIERMIAEMGGSVLGYYAITNGEWHIAALVELPDAVSHADLGRLELAQTASGAIDRLILLPLSTPEALDGASRVAETAYRAPS